MCECVYICTDFVVKWISEERGSESETHSVKQCSLLLSNTGTCASARRKILFTHQNTFFTHTLYSFISRLELPANFDPHESALWLSATNNWLWKHKNLYWRTTDDDEGDEGVAVSSWCNHIIHIFTTLTTAAPPSDQTPVLVQVAKHALESEQKSKTRSPPPNLATCPFSCFLLATEKKMVVTWGPRQHVTTSHRCKPNTVKSFRYKGPKSNA